MIGDEMGETVGQLLVQRLIDWGVDTIFGLPGDGINGMIRGTPHRGQIALTVLSDKIKELI